MISSKRDNPTPSYPGRANFSLISLKKGTNRLHENFELVSGGETTRLGESQTNRVTNRKSQSRAKSREPEIKGTS